LILSHAADRRPGFAVGSLPEGVAVGDVNGDGRADIVGLGETTRCLNLAHLPVEGAHSSQ
jgi:hypothetical protein